MRDKRFGWIWFVAGRYIFKGRGNSPSPVLAVLGIAVGVLALIVILAVMNGFQLSFIESILEISSYHLRVEGLPPVQVPAARELLTNIQGVSAAVPFREFQALVRGKRGGQQALLVRGIPANALELDGAMATRLEIEDGSFDIKGKSQALLGAELARRLGVRTGDTIMLFSISGILSAGDSAAAGTIDDAAENTGAETFSVSGIFRTGFYEYDTGWAFINIESAAAFSDAAAPVLGVKLKNRFNDRQILKLAQLSLAALPGFESAKFSTWRDYNRSFFGALRTEKLFMFILVGLIFIVVGLNIFQAQRRSVLERREELALLRALGGGERAVRFVFIWDGAIIGLSGAGSGLALGLLIASHIPLFFAGLEGIINFFIAIINFFADLFGAGGAGAFAVFSPAVFYIKEIPSRIIPREVALIFLFGFLSALIAAWFASRKVSRIQPAEVLRYE
jgi:lipoprotein-releasing system permease protein